MTAPIEDIIVRIELQKMIELFIDKPDNFYRGEAEPTDKLIEYLKRHNVNIPQLPEDMEERKAIVKLMVRIWSSIEAIESITKLNER